MKAVLLAAGIASRLRPLTDTIPKCLLELGGKTILQRTIDNLLSEGITEFIIVTGYLHEKIEAFVNSSYPDLRVTFIYNEVYESTNNIYSLWLAKNAVGDDDILLLDSDILFDRRIVRALLDSPRADCLALNRDIELGDEEIKVLLDGQQRIRAISKLVPPGDAAGESIGIERFSREYHSVLFSVLERMIVDENRVDIFYEAAFEETIKQGESLFAVDISGLPCMELDTVEDLERASRTVIPLLMKLAVVAIVALGIAACDILPNSSGKLPTAGPAVDDALISKALESLLSEAGDANQLARADCAHFEMLADFYRRRNYHPIWINRRSYPQEFRSVFMYLSSAGEHGLNPHYYHSEPILHSLDRAKVEGSGRYAAFANAELLMSDAIVNYCKDLEFGVFDPVVLSPSAYKLPARRPNRADLLRPLTTGKGILAMLDELQPREKRYLQLQQALRRLREIEAEQPWPLIPELEKEKLEPGDQSAMLGYLARRLMLSGDMGVGLPPHPQLLNPLTRQLRIADELRPERYLELGPAIYEGELVEAVKHYQSRNGLLVDGIIGRRTLERLNKPPAEQIAGIAINLERFRWLRYPQQGRYVRVNIPAYYLYAVEDDEIVTEMAVCVGQRRGKYYKDQLARYNRTRSRRHRPKDHETPQIHGSFTHVILNPFWNVPQSIGEDELYYSAKKDSAFLRKKNYKVFLKDSLVTPEEIDWSQYSPSYLPFRFRQEPGGGNALGHIKFMFENDFSIYLHDTPTRYPFTRSYRAVSHGCVRIEKPMAFAKFLLEGTPEWTAKKLQQQIWKGVRSKPVFLKRTAPLYIDYYTAWVDPDGTLQLRDDLYRKDEHLKTVNAERSPSPLQGL